MSRQKRTLPTGVILRAGSPYFYVKVQTFDPRRGRKVAVATSTGVRAQGATKADLQAVVLMRDKLRVKAGEQRLLEEVAGRRHGARLADLVDDHLRRLEREATPEWARSARLVSAKHIVPFFGPDTRLDAITYERMEDWVDELAENGYERSTINSYLAVLRGAFTTAVRKGHVTAVPRFPFYPKARLNVRAGVLEPADYKRLSDAACPTLRPLLAVLYWVGVRRGEALALEWSKNVQFGVGGLKGLLSLSKTKNDHARNCPLYGELYEALAAQKAVRDQFFPATRAVFFWHACDVGHGAGRYASAGDPVRAVTMRRLWREVLEDAGMSESGLLVHDLRRSAVTNMLQSGNFTEKEAMTVSGHLTDSMLRRYQITRKVELEATAAKFEAMHAALMGSIVQPAPLSAITSETATFTDAAAEKAHRTAMGKRRGGLAGGLARAASLSPERRSEIGKMGAREAARRMTERKSSDNTLTDPAAPEKAKGAGQ